MATSLKISEREILNAILDYLRYRSIPAWRQNCGAMSTTYNGKSRFIRFNRPGAADISGLLPSHGGRRLEIEVKAAKGRVTPAQEAFLSMIREAGGVAGVCRSVEDVVELLREAE